MKKIKILLSREKLAVELAKVIHREENYAFGDQRTRWSDLTKDCQADCIEIARAALRFISKRLEKEIIYKPSGSGRNPRSRK